MSTFEIIASRIVEEAKLERAGLTPEYVLVAWVTSRYRSVLDDIPFGEINRQTDVVLTTSEEYKTGTVSLTKGSRQVIGNGTNFIDAFRQRFIRIANNTPWYQIEEVTSPSSLLLDTEYSGDSVSEASYSIAQRYYILDSPIRWIIDVKNIARNFNFNWMSRAKLDELFPSRIAAPSVPQWGCPYGFDDANVRRIIEIYPPANTLYRLEITGYSNVEEPTFDSIPVIDIDDRVLIEGGLADAFNYLAGLEDDPVRTRAKLDVASRHENKFRELSGKVLSRDGRDANNPRIKVRVGGWDYEPRRDPIMTAYDEVMNRGPRYG